VAGTVGAEDADGVDSVWVSVDLVVAGVDGRFERSFSAPFRVAIAAGKAAMTRIPIQFRARDVAGFMATRDTFVVVVP
jgi:hypothetical protein